MSDVIVRLIPIIPVPYDSVANVADAWLSDNDRTSPIIEDSNPIVIRFFQLSFRGFVNALGNIHLTEMAGLWFFSESKYFFRFVAQQKFLRHKVLTEYFFLPNSEIEFFFQSNFPTEIFFSQKTIAPTPTPSS